jgi:hypothetical protein
MAEGDDADLGWDALGDYIRNASADNPLTCPQGGAADDYAIGDATTLPTCTINPERHVLPGAAAAAEEGGEEEPAPEEGG